MSKKKIINSEQVRETASVCFSNWLSFPRNSSAMGKSIG
jgi:hypothetical protein